MSGSVQLNKDFGFDLSSFTIGDPNEAVKIRKEFEESLKVKSSMKMQDKAIVKQEEITPEEKDLMELMLKVLYVVKEPVSISYMNLLLTQKHVHELTHIDYNFLKKFQTLFCCLVIGQDLKIQLRNISKITEASIPDHPSAHFYTNAFEKDHYIAKKIMDSISAEPKELSELVKTHTTNKYKVGLTFLFRNSQYFKFVSNKGNVYIHRRLNTTSSDVIAERDIWHAFEHQGFQKVLADRLAGLLQIFNSPINQGTLQSCFNYGVHKLDNHFLASFSSIFKVVPGPAIVLVSYSGPVPSSPEKQMNSKKLKCQQNVGDQYKEAWMNQSSCIPEDTIKSLIGCPQSVVVINKSYSKPQVSFNPTLSRSDKLKALVTVRELCEEEINQLKQA